MSKAAVKSKSEPTFLGHPIGLLWLAASEFWERFCYYGMQALLTLYLFNYLLQPEHIREVWGFASFQHGLDWLIVHVPVIFKKSDMAYASYTSQLYASLVYFTPLFGGPIADRLLGRTATVTVGSILMMIGTFLLAANSTFLLGLAFLLGGVGCFKGNIAAQVGDLYSKTDNRRADAFQIYMMGIQFAVVFSPLVCSTLGEKYNWHWGFMAAGIGMAIGLTTYLLSRKTFPPEPIRREGPKVIREPLSARDWAALILLVLLLPVLAFSIVGNQQIFNVYLVWSETNYQLTFFGWTVPSTWMMSFDAVFSFVTMFAVISFWRWYGNKRKEPDELTKIIIGVLISMFAPIALAGASSVVAQTHQPVGLIWAVAFHLINDTGFAMVLPVGLALYSRAAPKGLGGTMLGVYYWHLFIANTFLVGILGGFYKTIPDTQFWMLHVYLMVGAAAVLIVVKLLFGHLLAPVAAPEAAA